MRFVLHTNSVSTHQLPLAREIVRRVGAENFRYVYTGTALQGGRQEVAAAEPWILRDDGGAATEWLEGSDVLLASLRTMDLLERRSAKGLTTLYQSERWFKPIPLFAFTPRLHLLLPGRLRMLVPGYRRMARRFVRLARTDPNFRVLPIGPWAKRDFLRIGVPEDKMTDWGYFVEPSARSTARDSNRHSSTSTPGFDSRLRVLWIGRPIWLKRTDTIRKAVAHVPNATLDLFTDLAPEEVREEMRRHEVFVFSSNAMDGWGAVVSEALAEGMHVFGTFETGASAALLPKENLFPCGDWRTLARMLRKLADLKAAGGAPPSMSLPAAYTPAGAAARLPWTAKFDKISPGRSGDCG